MRTEATLPASWAVEQTLDGRRIARDRGWPADLALVLHPLWPLPDLAAAAATQLVERDLPAGARARIVRQAEGKTELGAPMVLIDAQVTSPGGVVEERLCALYHFLEYAGGATLRASDAARLAEHRAEVLSILATARPDFTGHIAALEQLFVGLEEEGSWVRS